MRYGSPYYTKPFWLFSNYHPYFNVYYDFYNPWSISSKECTIESLEKCKDNYYHEACFDSKYNECLEKKQCSSLTIFSVNLSLNLFYVM